MRRINTPAVLARAKKNQEFLFHSGMIILVRLKELVKLVRIKKEETIQ